MNELTCQRSSWRRGRLWPGKGARTRAASPAWSGLGPCHGPPCTGSSCGGAGRQGHCPSRQRGTRATWTPAWHAPVQWPDLASRLEREREREKDKPEAYLKRKVEAGAKALPRGRVLEALEEALLRNALDRAAPAPMEHQHLVAVHHARAHSGFERLKPLAQRGVLDLLDLDQPHELVQCFVVVSYDTFCL